MCVWCACVYKYMWVIGVNISILWCVCSMWYACVCRVCVYMRYECGCVCMWLCVGGMYVATCVWVVYITVCMWGGYVAVCVCGVCMWLCVCVGDVCGCVCMWGLYMAVCVCGRFWPLLKQQFRWWKSSVQLWNRLFSSQSLGRCQTSEPGSLSPLW